MKWLRLLYMFFYLSLFVSLSTPVRAFDTSQYKGKVVYLDFWASWCGPCKLAFPWMEEMYKKYKDQGLVVVAVNLDSDKADALTFLKPYTFSFEIQYDPNGKISSKYNVEAMPTAIILDRKGKLVSSHLGFESKKTNEYEKEIQAILKKK